ncbi:hypothetical protein ABTB92_20685, partial [Acinetobacter baumannii]
MAVTASASCASDATPILPDGINAALSPAYDIVPFFYYGDDSMALQFGKTVDPAVVNLRRFERL